MGGVSLRLSELRREFKADAMVVPVLSGVTLEVPSGQFVALLGPSGCGKSTLLRIIAGLDRPDDGAVQIDREVRPIAFVFQEAHLLPWRTLEHNVALPLELSGKSPGERRDRVHAMLDMVGLLDARERYPNELSGGMQMRGSLARALVTDPRLLLLDEPFAALDEITRQRLDGLLYQIWRKQHFTALFVTHSLREAVFLAQRTVMLSRRPARIVRDELVPLAVERPDALRQSLEFNQLVETHYQALLAAEGAA